MKKYFTILVMILLIFVLNGCTDRYKQLNEFVDTVLVEEKDYIFFTNNHKIEESTKINLEEVIADILNQNDIDYDYISFSYILRNDLLHFTMNIKVDRKNRHTRAVIVIDPISLTEIFVKTYHVGEKGVYVDFDESSNIIIQDNNNDIVTIYWYENNIYKKYEISLSQYKSEDFIFDFEEKWIIDGINYNVENNSSNIKIVSDDGNIYYENTLFDMFKESNVGSKIHKYSKVINQEIKDVKFREYDLYFYNNELYIVFRFKKGLLFNHSLFGQTDEIIFRFDFKSKKIIYIGNSPEHVRYIYN